MGIIFLPKPRSFLLCRGSSIEDKFHSAKIGGFCPFKSRRERYTVTEEQKATIQDLHSKGEGYKKIAQELGLSENTIKSFCRRTQVPKAEPEPVPADACECCGKPIEQTAGRKHKRFCSDVCRRKWWNSHRGRVSRKLVAYVLDSDFYSKRQK